MAYSITQFENSATNSLQALDNNFTTFGALVQIPCSVAGTNTLTLTQNAVGLVPTPTISAYTTNMLFSGIASGTNTGPTTATIGSVGALPVYKDSNIILNRYFADVNTWNGEAIKGRTAKLAAILCGIWPRPPRPVSRGE